MNPHRSLARFAATTLVIAAYVTLSAGSVGCGSSNDTTNSGSTSVVSGKTTCAVTLSGTGGEASTKELFPSKVEVIASRIGP